MLRPFSQFGIADKCKSPSRLNPLTDARAGGFLAAMLYGYARESAGSASLEEQADELTAAGCAVIFRETDPTKRPQLAQAIHAAGFGDVLMVTRLDRLARGAGDLLTLYRKLYEKGAGVLSLSETITDPATDAGRWFPYFVEWFAAFDAVTFKERMREGRTAAKARAVRWGQPPKLTPQQVEKAAQLYTDPLNPRTLAEIAGRFNVSLSTISRALAKHRAAKA